MVQDVLLYKYEKEEATRYDVSVLENPLACYFCAGRKPKTDKTGFLLPQEREP